MQYPPPRPLAADSLKERLEAFGLDTPSFNALLSAYKFSERTIEEARQVLAKSFDTQRDFDDCLIFGSIARREATACSDLDYLLINASGSDSLDETLPNRVFQALKELAPERSSFTPPGTTGLFGRFISSSSLVSGIGLQQDTNETLTRRILLLEESVPLLNPKCHTELVQRIIESYMGLRSPCSTKPPRVLINDIIRYWRTIAVDYHAKSSRDNVPYSLRYLKLLCSRQLCYFSSLAPMYLVDGKHKDEATQFLVEQFSIPPILRTITLFEHLFKEHPTAREELQMSLRTIIDSMNKFIDLSGNAEWRAKIESECQANRSLEDMPFFFSARKLGIDLHKAFAETLLHPALKEFTTEYVLL